MFKEKITGLRINIICWFPRWQGKVRLGASVDTILYHNSIVTIFYYCCTNNTVGGSDKVIVRKLFYSYNL